MIVFFLTYWDTVHSNTNPNNYSSDNDTLSDAMEVLVTHTDPWKDDTDNDGLNDSTEYQNGLNPLSNDTDSDQWDDYHEFYYWHTTRNLPASDAYANCKNPDVDGDGITDYQEVNGYTVKVATSFDQNNNPIMQEKTMYGDPLQAYKQAGGAWTDTDCDGIPDIVEVYFSNTTNINNNATWDHIIQSVYPWLANYQWCREYYWALNGSDTSKAENWTQKAFNPFVVCNLPPMITDFTVEAHEEWGLTWYGYVVTACYLTVSTVIKSVGGFGNIYIGARPLDKDSDTVGWSASPWDSALTQVSYDNIRLDVDWWTLKLTGYCTHLDTCSVADIGGRHPAVSASHEIEGIGRFIANIITNFFAMLTGGLQNTWDAVEKGVTNIVDYLYQQIADKIQAEINTVCANIQNKINSIWGHVDQSLKTTANADFSSMARENGLFGVQEMKTFFGALLGAASTADAMTKPYMTCPAIYKPLNQKIGKFMIEQSLKVVRVFYPIEDSTIQAFINKIERGEITVEIPGWLKGLDITNDRALVDGLLQEYLKWVSGTGTKAKIASTGNEFRQNEMAKVALIIGEGGWGIDAAVRNECSAMQQEILDRYALIGNGFNFNANRARIFQLIEELGNILTGLHNAGTKVQVVIVICAHGDSTNHDRFIVGPDPEHNPETVSWQEFADALDAAVFTDNHERMYEKMLIIAQTCFSGRAIAPLTQRDSTNRAVITAVDKDEVAAWMKGINRLVFLGHFVDFLLKRAGEEFVLTLLQFFYQFVISIFPWLLASAIGIGAVIGALVGGPPGAAAGALCGAVIALIITFLVPLTVAIYNMVKSSIHGGMNRNMVECYNYASATVQVLPFLLGNGAPTGLYWNRPQMFNVDKLSNFWM